jgi:hypothetical protein
MLFADCHSEKKNPASNTTVRTKPVAVANKQAIANSDKDVKEMVDEATLPFYLVIADTGLNYDILHAKMLAVNKTLNIKIDTLGRFYNRKKNLIQLPDNADDEVYAGDYFLRRGEGESLSLEYLNAYKRGSNEKMMALLSGIYEKKSSADSALAILKRYDDHSFVVKTKIYMGCVH